MHDAVATQLARAPNVFTQVGIGFYHKQRFENVVKRKVLQALVEVLVWVSVQAQEVEANLQPKEPLNNNHYTTNKTHLLLSK